MTLVDPHRPHRHLGRLDVRVLRGRPPACSPRPACRCRWCVLASCAIGAAARRRQRRRSSPASAFPSIVVTLATMIALRDGLRWATEGAWIQDLPAELSVARHERRRSIRGSSSLVVVAAAGGVRLGPAPPARRTRRSTRPARAPQAARLAGIRVEAVTTVGVRGRRGAGRAGRAAELGALQPDSQQHRARPRAEGDRRGRRRRHRDHRRPRIGAPARCSASSCSARSVRRSRSSASARTGSARSTASSSSPRSRPTRCAPGRRVAHGRRARMPAVVKRFSWFPNNECDPAARRWPSEIALFAAIAPNFATVGNFFEISRLSVELGLLAIALTPVIVTGGIDLSVGAMMGLAAVLFGVAWQDWRLPIVAAAADQPADRARRRRAERRCWSRGWRSRRSSSRSARCRCSAASPRASPRAR